MNNNTLVERIDGCLKERNLKRLALCDAVGITPTAITHWKTQKSIPSADTAVKIAQYLDVSIDWLIFGTCAASDEPFSPQQIASRIKNILVSLTGSPSYDKQERWFTPLNDILPLHSLNNWEAGRNYPDLAILEKIASSLSVQLQFLLTGTTDSEYDAFTCGLAKKYEFIIKGFHSLSSENQKMVDTLIAHLLKTQ